MSALRDDGTIVEMVYRHAPGETLFLSAKAEHVEECREASDDRGSPIRPYSPTNNLLTHRVVLLPSDALSYDSEDALAADVRAFIRRYVDVSESFEEIAAFYVLLTWVHDAFNELPYLRVKGDYGTGKSRFLLTVGSICYKPIFASGASTVSPIFRLLDAVGGTLVIDEGDFRASDEKAEIVKILNNGNARGFPVLRSEATPTKEYNPRAFRVFGPKLVATRGAFEDQALESRCITEELIGRRPRPDIPLNLPPAFDEEALALRNRLLTFRFRNLLRDRDLSALHDPSIEPRISQIIAPLLATMPGGEARKALLTFARRHSGTIAVERQLSIEAQLLEVIATLRGSGAELSLKVIAEAFERDFAQQYNRPVTPRWVGSLLRRRLGLNPVRRAGTFTLSAEEYPLLDVLLERYGLQDVGRPQVTSESTAPE